MEIEVVNRYELINVMQHVNLTKIKFGYDDTWVMAPVLFATEENIDILIDSNKKIYPVEPGDKAILKFLKMGYEYLISGEIVDVNKGNPMTVTIKYSLSQKYQNIRRAMRFDANLKIDVKMNNEAYVESFIKNISRGGAMIVTSEDIQPNSLVNIKATFRSGNCFKTVAKVSRKSEYKNNCFSYGVQFIDVSEKNNSIINNAIKDYEKEYLKSLNIFREYKKQADIYFNTKIAIFSYDIDESYEIKEVLVKLGAENFESYHGFKVYADFFIDEKPKVVIIDANHVNEEIVCIVKSLNENHAGMNVILMLPIGYSEKSEEFDPALKKANILFKPLIYNEFEKEIMKHL